MTRMEISVRCDGQEVFDARVKYYGLDQLKDDNDNPIELTDEEALGIINIRYTMGLTAYRKYESTTIASDVSKETMTDVLENSANLKGVGIEESTIRVYNDSVYFAPIIGYIGKVWDDELEKLRETNPDYELTDLVGKTGIEASMETELQGKKGSQTMYVDSMGRILEVVKRTEPEAGHDIYLTLDRDLQIGVYHILEQQLAGIITDKLVNRDLDDNDYEKAANIPIPVKDVYYQLINNNVLDLVAFSAPERPRQRKTSMRSTASRRTDPRTDPERAHGWIRKKDGRPAGRHVCLHAVYLYVAFRPWDHTDRQGRPESDTYNAWKNDSISLRDYLYDGIAESWIDTTKLKIESRYSDADSIYQTIVEYDG